MIRTKLTTKKLNNLRKCPQVYELLESDLDITQKERIFIQEYLYDWNKGRAARAAGYSHASCYVTGNEILKKPKVKMYMKEMQAHLEQQIGLSKIRVLHEHMKIGFSSIAHLHNTWIERKEFEELTEDQKACISEVTTQTKRVDTQDGPVMYIDYVKIKLYDKQKSLDAISRMLGYDSPQQINIKTEAEITHTYRTLGNYLSDLSPEELSALKKIGLPQLGLDVRNN